MTSKGIFRNVLCITFAEIVKEFRAFIHLKQKYYFILFCNIFCHFPEHFAIQTMGKLYKLPQISQSEDQSNKKREELQSEGI